MRVHGPGFPSAGEICMYLVFRINCSLLHLSGSLFGMSHERLFAYGGVDSNVERQCAECAMAHGVHDVYDVHMYILGATTLDRAID